MGTLDQPAPKTKSWCNGKYFLVVAFYFCLVETKIYLFIYFFFLFFFIFRFSSAWTHAKTEALLFLYSLPDFIFFWHFWNSETMWMSFSCCCCRCFYSLPFFWCLLFICFQRCFDCETNGVTISTNQKMYGSQEWQKQWNKDEVGDEKVGRQNIFIECICIDLMSNYCVYTVVTMLKYDCHMVYTVYSAPCALYWPYKRVYNFLFPNFYHTNTSNKSNIMIWWDGKPIKQTKAHHLIR